MSNCFYTGFAVVCIIAVSLCGASPRRDTVTVAKQTAMDDSYLKISQWLGLVIASAKRLVPNNNIQDGAEFNVVNKQNSTFKVADDSLPVLIHKEDEESGIKMIPSSTSSLDKVNPFFRSKRSACATPANLPQRVKDLNSRLTSSQLVGLNSAEYPLPTMPANQPNTCPSGPTGDWWPRSEVNLRSTCPWKLQQVDLGVDAFPRYVNNAICLCNSSCIGSPSMRCMEVTYDVTYFNRTGCENGLALLEARKYTINIGCHCASALTQTTIRNHNSE